MLRLTDARGKTYHSRMLVLRLLFQFVKVLNEKTSPKAIAAGVALGAVVGLTPKLGLHNLLIVFLLFLVNVNGTAAAFGAMVFTLFSYLFDPLFNRLGYGLLTAGPLRGLWTALYNTPVFPWTRFNNTLVLGSLTSSLLLFWPIYALVVRAVPRYRERVLARAAQWKVFHMMKASKLYDLYQKFS
jgi:uncharacterized protein (TIGR03546 family)